jgi:zinc protease
VYGHYRQFYIPNNATLVIVGDVDTDTAVRLAERHFGAIPPGPVPARQRTVEPEQTGERRVTLRKEGTAAYLKLAYHAPAAADPAFCPALVLDAVLSGAKGVNLWSSFRVPPPQRGSRLYRALVDRGVASCVSGSLLPTEQPFLYMVSATETDGILLASVESATLDVLDDVAAGGITFEELTKAKAQLHARLVFDSDSVTNIAHQIGYFETIASADVFLRMESAIQAVTLEAVAETARQLFRPSNRTVAWFDPLPVASS